MKDRFIRFMQGRYGAYGTDRLTKFLLIITLILIVLTSFGPMRTLSIFTDYFVDLQLFQTFFQEHSQKIP